MAVDSFSSSPSEVLNDLDPLARALLDLSLKRGMSDEEIGEILGTDAEAVLENRIALMRSLAERVAPGSADAEQPELESALADRFYGEEAAGATVEPEPEPVAIEEPEPVAIAEPEPERVTDEPHRRRSALVLIVPLLILAALIIGLIAVIGGDDDEDAGSTGQRAEQQQPSGGDDASEAEARRVRLTALGASGARGTAVVTDGGLRLRIGGLPRGHYEVWLYDNVIDARRVGRVAQDGTFRLKLPSDARDYRYLDFSREPNDGNPNHSGESVLRVPVEKLAGS